MHGDREASGIRCDGDRTDSGTGRQAKQVDQVRRVRPQDADALALDAGISVAAGSLHLDQVGDHRAQAATEIGRAHV